MVSLFGNKNAGWVGVDIGSSSVKLVSLSQHGRDYQVDSYAVVPLPPSAVVDGTVENQGEVSEAIERGLKICGNKLKHAVVAVPSSAVITKRLEISNAFSEQELEEQVKIEADQFIPYSLDEVALDFEVIGPVDHHPTLNEILLVACRRDDVSTREEAVNGAELQCEIVDVDTFAVERLLPLLEGYNPDTLVGLVDIGASTLTLNVFKAGKIIYNREQAFGGNELTNAIHQQYGLEVAEIEQKLRSGSLDEEIVEMLVMPFRQSVIQQVSRALQFFYSSGVQNQLSEIYLAGGTAAITGLAELMQEEIGVASKVVNPFSNIRVGSRLNQDRLMNDAPMLAKACGLALRSFDR
ncbi:Type IV pilus biogenesis protein PilM [Marinobacterium lacunae]|uniref:Type IV pilus biogenesis protein PilM n=1 Tax=Marinobacterium lacunae TaxID=1232683 RepID=A0A081G2T1_9GAMM|nr:type IV pilus assembly protein PilM [Marinobacterium lacunae]KEA65086.1 Type IV pilus biogenesis protein PilM [Marinobacterium lacunae]